MIFTKTGLDYAVLLHIEKHEDLRGFFARTYCENEFAEKGITFRPVQANISGNKRKHTLRGMHYQVSPFEEAKLVSCIKGAIFDVIIDLRDDSSTFHRWYGAELTAVNRRMMYIPEGFAHGFMTLENNTEVHYLMSEFYAPGKDAGIRWNDPAFKIEWPAEPAVISEKDQTWPLIGD